MGNCPGCLSPHGSSVHDDPSSQEDAQLITIVRSTDGELLKYPSPLFVKELLSGFHGFAVFSYTHTVGPHKPLHPDTQLSFNTRYHLKPLLKPSLKPPCTSYDPVAHTPCLQQHSTPLHPQEPLLVTAERSSNKPKIAKTVRFADEPVFIISPCSNQEVVLSSSCNNDKLQSQELSHNKQSSVLLNDGDRSEQSCLADVDASARPTRQGNSLDGALRLKVFISKKDLTELMSPKTPEKEAEAMVERIIAPLLSPQHRSTRTCSQIS